MGLRWVIALVIKLWQVSWNLWEYRNGIEQNTITPQVQWKLEEIAILLKQQEGLGVKGLRTKDHHLIASIPSTWTKPLKAQQRLLETLVLTREAALVERLAQTALLERRRRRFKSYFTTA